MITRLDPQRRNAQPRIVPGAEAVFGHLLRISRALAGHLDFQAAIQSVSAELGDVLPHDHLDVCLLGSGGNIHAAYEAGLHTDWSLNPHPVPVSGSPIRRILLGQEEAMVTGDATRDPRFGFEGAFNHPIFDQNLRSRVHAAMLVRGEVIGAFSCSKHDADFYGEDDMTLARHVGEMLAPYFYALRASQDARRLAIEEAEGRAREEGLREGALRLTEELERERQRIGMDLHDQTLADLTRIVRRLEALREGSPAPESLSPTIEGLHRCVGELRRIIDDARPNVLELFGFAEGVEDFLGRALFDAGVEWRLDDASGGLVDTLDPALRLAVFRIVQEAVNNAARHAEPSLIEVRVAGGRDGTLRVEVRDDGIGFAPIPQRRRVGGIRNMQTRARLISASFFLDRQPGGRGTLMSLVLPVASGAAVAS
ncbi:sensor histidine kinase [Aureimonas flava]|uniref:histidine kinase n=1 Tax=Aureimonas flava TaxID=2320271 RepID=A0A3A1WKN7_9HYPH|nr:ATP-binding protein [Aureimonas flava]RIY01869.1 sensor histidine kinase [Aureimonas flava]